MDFHEVPTTCTAKQITDWDLEGRTNENPLRFAQYNKKIVEQLIRNGFYQDFALLFAIVTHDQRENYHLDKFFEKIGFEEAFVGEKEKGTAQRHQETGNLYMYCAKPVDYKRCLEAYKKELDEEINKLDRRRQDPERLKMPDLLLRDLRKAGLVRPNAFVDNAIKDVIMPGVDPKAIQFFIKSGYGLDVVEAFGENWINRNSRVIKEAQIKWKQELLPY